MRRASLAVVVALSLAACSDDGEPPMDMVPSGFISLVTADWNMPASDEGYWCARVTVPEDIFIEEFRPIAPAGTHHTALSIDAAGGDDGVFPCQASTTGFQILFGSGLGTESFALPEGVAFKVPAGTQLLLNLHLYNFGEAMITGRSGIEVRLAEPRDVVHEAETIYVLDFDLEVPTGESTHRVSCTMNGATTVFGVFPHMHRLGTHMRGVAHRGGIGGEEIVLHDEAFAFEEQLDYRIEPSVELEDGDVVSGDCSFYNPDAPVSFGDSTDSEMCVLGLYRYPAQGGISLCSG
jgi:hypothetical protein